MFTRRRLLFVASLGSSYLFAQHFTEIQAAGWSPFQSSSSPPSAASSSPSPISLSETKALKVLQAERKLNWGGKYEHPSLTPSEKDKIEEFQKLLLLFREGKWKPAKGEEEEIFSLRRRLAMAAWERALAKCPRVLTPMLGAENLVVSVRLPGEKSDVRVMPIFTSREMYEAFKSKLPPQQHASLHFKEVSGAALISEQLATPNFRLKFDRLYVNPLPDFSDHSGAPTSGEIQMIGLQSVSLLMRFLLSSNQAFSNPAAMDQVAFTLLESGGSFLWSAPAPGKCYLQAFLSDAHRDATIYHFRKQGRQYGEFPMTLREILMNWHALPPQVVGLTLDRLPPEFEPFGGIEARDYLLDLQLKVQKKRTTSTTFCPSDAAGKCCDDKETCDSCLGPRINGRRLLFLALKMNCLRGGRLFKTEADWLEYVERKFRKKKAAHARD